MPRYTKNVGLMAQCITNINLSYKPTFYWCLKAVANKATWRAGKTFFDTYIQIYCFLPLAWNTPIIQCTLKVDSAHRPCCICSPPENNPPPPHSQSSAYPPTSVEPHQQDRRNPPREAPAQLLPSELSTQLEFSPGASTIFFRARFGTGVRFGLLLPHKWEAQ